MTTELFINESVGAVLSEDRRYRYRLWRTWDPLLPKLCFVGLNPSTADETEDDQTITVLKQRAKDGGFGGVLVVNLYALRSRDPGAILTTRHPITAPFEDADRNDREIRGTALAAGLVLCGWGTHGGLRGREVLAQLRKVGVTPHALVVNADGSPRHPLYVGYDVKPIPMPT